MVWWRCYHPYRHPVYGIPVFLQKLLYIITDFLIR